MPDLDDLAETERRAWAAVEGAPINDAVGALCDALGNVSGCAMLIDPATGAGMGSGFARTDPDLIELLRTKYATLETNPFLHSIPRMPAARLMYNQDVLDMDRVRRTEFYEDWWLPTGVGLHAGALALPSPDGRLVWVAIGCLGEREWLTAEELRFAEIAIGGIARALRTRASLAHEHARGRVTGQDPDASWLVGPDGRFHLSNEAARTVMAEGGPIWDRGGRLAIRGAGAVRFGRLRDVVLRGEGDGGSFVIGTPTGFSHLDIEPGPVYRDDRTVLVTLRAPRPLAWSTEALREAFDLTEREADVALAVGQGATPAEIGAALRITAGSVRLYLKRIFAKTGSHGQVALVSRLLHGR